MTIKITVPLDSVAAMVFAAANGVYNDCCPQCQKTALKDNDSDVWCKSYPPSDIKSMKPGWVVFEFKCDEGHLWTCGFAILGGAKYDAVTTQLVM